MYHTQLYEFQLKELNKLDNHIISHQKNKYYLIRFIHEKYTRNVNEAIMYESVY